MTGIVRHDPRGNPCPKCEEYLLQADPRLAAWFRRAKQAFPAVHVSCSWRGQRSQDRAVVEGRSKSPWPKSKHNAMRDGKPCSLALDLFDLDPKGTAVFSTSSYASIADWSEKAGEPITCGVRWKNFCDPPHFELKAPAT